MTKYGASRTGRGVGGAIRTGGEWEGVSRSCSEGLGGVGAVGAVRGVGVMERLPQSQRVGAAGYVNTN